MASCSSSGDSDEQQMPSDGPSVLNIYVFAPGQAVPTRGNEGEVNANPDAEENAINTLQIWVFTHQKYTGNTPDNVNGTQKLVTYFMTTTASDKYELPIPDWFVASSSPENVDVFVLANVTSNNCGLDFGETTTHAELEGAVLKGNYFGLSTTPVMEVPFEGLPMSGVLYDQSITNTRPILTLGSPENMAKVKLARAVSKIRFVFSCSTDFDGLKINSVTLDNGVIPDEEYLFLTDDKNPYGYKDNDYNIKGTSYNVVDDEHPAPSLFSIDATAQCEDPAHYAWDRLENDEKAKNPAITDQALAEAYEALVDEGLSSNIPATYSSDDPPVVIDPGHETPRLTERRVYLRESDKQLTGTIKYQVKEKGAADYSAEKEAVFSMDAAGDFSRNHTWIVYAYLTWAKIEIVAVKIVEWTTSTGEQELYNW